jgi:hypothetical protein
VAPSDEVRRVAQGELKVTGSEQLVKSEPSAFFSVATSAVTP